MSKNTFRVRAFCFMVDIRSIFFMIEKTLDEALRTYTSTHIHVQYLTVLPYWQRRKDKWQKRVRNCSWKGSVKRKVSDRKGVLGTSPIGRYGLHERFSVIGMQRRELLREVYFTRTTLLPFKKSLSLSIYIFLSQYLSLYLFLPFLLSFSIILCVFSSPYVHISVSPSHFSVFSFYLSLALLISLI